MNPPRLSLHSSILFITALSCLLSVVFASTAQAKMSFPKPFSGQKADERREAGNGKKVVKKKAVKKFIVASNPLMWLLGQPDVQLGASLGKHFGVRADVSRHKDYGFDADSNLDTDGFESKETPYVEFNINAAVFTHRAFHGFFVEPGVAYRVFDRVGDGQKYDLGVHLHGGAQHTFDSGFSLALALGRGSIAATNREGQKGEGYFSGYLRAGFAF